VNPPAAVPLVDAPLAVATSDVLGALGQLPNGLFVMTGQYEGKRTGVIVRLVCQVACDPPLVCVSLRKGHWISPLVRDSHYFGLSRVAAADRLVAKKFHEANRPKDGDPFDCMQVERLVSGTPLLAKSNLVVDCEVTRHLDLEADYEMFIGKVLGVRASGEGAGTAVGGAGDCAAIQGSEDEPSAAGQ